MARLSLPIEQLKSHYSVIVIGSGYGGSITASRMARAVAPDNQKITVCVLERGKEFQPRDLDENGRVIKPGEYLTRNLKRCARYRSIRRNFMLVLGRGFTTYA